MRIAVLEDGKVVNIIVADEAFAKANLKDYRVLKDGEVCPIYDPEAEAEAKAPKKKA